MPVMGRQAWDERYRGEELLWRAEPNQFVVAEVERLRPGTALDLGCGEGRNAVWLATRGWRVTGVDFSAVGLAKARALAERSRAEVDWVEADLLDYEPPIGTIDLVLVAYLHLPADERRIVLGRAAAALADGGVLLVIGHDVSNLTMGHGGPKDASILFTPDDIRADLDGLRIERAERVQRLVHDAEGEHEAIDALVRADRSSTLPSPL